MRSFLAIIKMIKARMRKLKSSAANEPMAICAGPILHTASLHDSAPKNGAAMGISTSFTIEPTSAVEAVPITKPTAKETMLNSFKNLANSESIQCVYKRIIQLFLKSVYTCGYDLKRRKRNQRSKRHLKHLSAFRQHASSREDHCTPHLSRRVEHCGKHFR